MNTEEHDDLWILLEKARTPQPSPFFSRNVLRAIREQQHTRSPGLAGWLRRWRVPALSAGLAFGAAALMFNQLDQPDSVALLAQIPSKIPYGSKIPASNRLRFVIRRVRCSIRRRFGGKDR